MIKIILTGAAGRMGQAFLKVLPSFTDIELIHAIDIKGHPQVGKKIYKNIKLETELEGVISESDVIVDFTTVESSMTNLKTAANCGKPIIIGTTGHTADDKGLIKALSKKIPIVYSPNMSVGVNGMWKLVEEAASLLGKDYQIDIVETHHVHKKDAPSGTAKKILEIVAQSGGFDLNKDVYLHSDNVKGQEKKKISVKSIREGEVVGDHTVIFTSPYERLEITHRAFSREVFANGALRAARWIVGKTPLLYDMSDVLGIRG